MFLFISILYVIFNYSNQQNIEIKHNYLERINASKVFEDVLIFDLNKDYINIQDLVVAEDFYLIAPGEEDSKGFATSVSKIDKSGKFLEEIYRSSDGSVIQGIAFDSRNELLIVGHINKAVSIDMNNNMVVKEVNFEKPINNLKIFKDELYVSGINYSESSKYYYLESYDPVSLKIISDEKQMKYEVERIKISRPASLSISDQCINVSMGQVNEIYSSSNDFNTPIISLKNMYQDKESQFDIIFSVSQGVIGEFVTTRFNYLNNSFIYFYNLKSNEQYLSKIGESSGFYDDIKNSGFYTLHFTNSNQYMFSYKKTKLNDGKISVALFKIKS
ncbi:hypothetical protein [Algoriphagus resistens]|uniref:hypothetical protein n=1 Tax=Algoriphagus resistens TaxID=1750590 RepID=UPI0012FB65A8|nr:hypothetical protein [Algoriphagus resistens]